MAEGHATGVGYEHPRADALVKSLERLSGQGLQQPELGPLRHHRHRLEQVLGRRAEPSCPGQDRLRDRGRNSPAPAASTSTTKNGLPPGFVVQLSALHAVGRRHDVDGFGRERGQLQASHPGGRSQFPEDAPERVRTFEESSR